jgi:hypothetical protein
MVWRITSDGFAENAVCHATCMTNYLLKRIKDDSEDYLTRLFTEVVFTVDLETFWAVVEHTETDKLCLFVKDL